MAARSIPTKQLRAECQLLERAVASQRPAGKPEFAARRPGGAENPETGAQGWFNYFRWLTRAHAAAGAPARQAPEARAFADAELLDALRSAPAPVRLLGRPDEAPPIYVYPKSLDALLMVHALDRQLAWMTAQHAALVTQKTAAAMDLLPRVVAAIGYAYHLLCWIVTTEGPGIPFRADDDRPEIPAHVAALEPWDVTRICAAHHKHMGRLAAMSALLDDQRADEGGTRPSWSAFVSTMEVETGQSAEHLVKFRSLASLMAAARLGSAARAGASKGEEG